MKFIYVCRNIIGDDAKPKDNRWDTVLHETSARDSHCNAGNFGVAWEHCGRDQGNAI